jgi:putative Ca2+/H+ antiporter (TMEM165/GDT1 family)
MLAAFLSALGLVFIAELSDKTALAALVLATRFRLRAVLAGAWAALTLQTAISVLAGSLLHLLPARPIHIATGIGFLIFAVLALREDEEEELHEESEKEAELERKRRLPPVAVCFLIVFAAEWGDLTQLATAALVARAANPIPPALGALAGILSASTLAAFVGAQTSRFLAPRVLQRAAAAVFAVTGVVILVTAFT